VQLSEAPSFKLEKKGNMTEYEKLELLHSQLDELINGNQLPVDELKILQSFVEDIREKHLTSNKLDKLQAPGYSRIHEKD
jgi:predicted signal transduction protein with EAL and GGDEF domain